MYYAVFQKSSDWIKSSCVTELLEGTVTEMTVRMFTFTLNEMNRNGL